MTLNQLRYFCTASRCHSITKAAEELYVTQPTVSVAIRDLEIVFGISLFYRKGNRLILTEEGEELREKDSAQHRRDPNTKRGLYPRHTGVICLKLVAV